MKRRFARSKPLTTEAEAKAEAFIEGKDRMIAGASFVLSPIAGEFAGGDR